MWNVVESREKKVRWCGALQPSLISYAACLVSPATSRLQLLGKHGNVTLQWVGAMPSLKHISSRSPLPFFFSDSTQGRAEVKLLGVSINCFFFWLRRGRRKENWPVCGQEAKKRCAPIWDRAVNCNIPEPGYNLYRLYILLEWLK